MTKGLTPRQQQVLDLYLSGLTYKQVAESCGFSPETLGPHLKRISRKLDCAPRISREALACAVAARTH